MKKHLKLLAALLIVALLASACSQPAAAPAAEPAKEPAAEPAAAPATEPATEPAGEPASLAIGQPASVTLATGGTSGAWYPIGVGIADLLTKADNNLSVSAEVTNGGVENARLMGANTAQFGFLNNDTAYFATKAMDAFADEEPYEIYGVASLYPSTMQICVLADSGINSMEDLKGKRVVVGTAASSAATMAWTILDAYGLNEDNITGSYLSFAEGADALKDGHIDCVMVFSAHPNNALTELSVTKKIKLLSIDAEHADQIIAEHSYFNATTIPGGTYKDIPEDVETLSLMSTICCDNTVSDAVVYQFVKGIYEGLDTLQDSHAMVAQIDVAHAPDMPIPLHPGAIAYYKEAGVLG